METPTYGALGSIRIPQDSAHFSEAMHLVPCSISHNGPAPVSDFFLPKPTGEIKDGLEIMEAALRGRKLLGWTMDLPADYGGYVLEKEKGGDGERTASLVSAAEVWSENNVDWCTRTSFRKITCWKHDTLPTSSDLVCSCFDWLHLSKIVHADVPKDEIVAMVAKLSKGASGVKRKSTDS